MTERYLRSAEGRLKNKFKKYKLRIREKGLRRGKTAFCRGDLVAVKDFYGKYIF